MPTDGTTPEEHAPAQANGRRAARTRAFDFRRPNKLSRDHLRNLQIIHETFSGQFSTLLSSSLRSVCAMSVSSIEELTYDEYVRDMPIPTHLSVLSLDPLPGVGIYQLPIDAAMVIVDLLLGGQGTPTPDLQRPLTEIESSLIRTVTDRALNELAYAFESVAELQPAVVGIESNPQFAQLAAPSDMVIVINLTLQIGEVCETELSLCYPFSTIKPIMVEMASDAASSGDPDVLAARERVAGRLQDVDVELSVTFEPVMIRSRDILTLRPGDVLTLGHPAEESLDAVVDGVPLFEVRPALKGKRLAAQVISPIRTHPAG